MLPFMWRTLNFMDRNLFLRTTPTLTPLLMSQHYVSTDTFNGFLPTYNPSYRYPLVPNRSSEFTTNDDDNRITYNNPVEDVTPTISTDKGSASESLQVSTSVPEKSEVSSKSSFSFKASQFLIENLLKGSSTIASVNKETTLVRAHPSQFETPVTKRRSSKKFSPRSNERCVKELTKRYACTVCKMSFTKFYNLNVHMRKHTNERPFKCSTCGKDFRRKDHLKDHEFIHSNRKPFQCKVCNKGFCQYRAHDNHVIRHHPNSPTAANILNKRCRSKIRIDFN